MSSSSDIQAFSLEVQAHIRRNAFFNVLDGGMFFLSLTFLSFETVLPVFIGQLGGGAFLVSLVPTIWIVTVNLSAVFVAGKVEQFDRKMPSVLRYGFAMRLPWLILGIMILLRGNLLAPLLPALTLVTLFFFGTFGGMSFPPYFDIVAKVLPMRIRGTVSSIRTMLGYILGVGGGFLITRILVAVPFPQNYGLIFVLGAIAAMMSLWFLSMVKEPVYPVRVAPMKTSAYVGALWKVLRNDRAFLRFNIARGFVTLLYSTGAFYAAFGVERFGLDDSFAGIFTTVSVVSYIAVSPLMGIIGDRFGHKVNMIAACVTPFAAVVTALWAPTVTLYMAAFVLMAVVQMTQFISVNNMCVEYGPPEQRPRYLALSGALMTPVALLTPLLGVIAQQAGYRVVFGVIAVVSFVGTAFITTRLEDPTARKTLAV